MPEVAPPEAERKRFLISVEGLDALLVALRGEGWRLMGPTVRDGAIVYDEIHGWRTCPSAGPTSRRRAPTACAARATTRSSATRSARSRGSSTCLPPVLRLWRAHAPEDGLRGRRRSHRRPPRLALIGVRSCDLHAIADPGPRLPRRAVRRPGLRGAARATSSSSPSTAGRPAGTCFCVSMGTGPRATSGFDLALTEVLDGDGTTSSSRSAAKRGAALLARVEPPAPATGRRGRRRRESWSARPAQHGPRPWTPTDIKDLLYRNLEHPRWDDVAERCLTCANCTMVCPTCFCTTVEDTTDLTGRDAERVRGAGTRASPSTSPTSTAAACAPRHAPRYRQWMTHKLATLDRPVRHLGLRRLRALHHLVPGRHRHHRGGARHPRHRAARQDERRPSMEDLLACSSSIRSCAGSPPSTAQASSAARANVRFPAARVPARSRGRAGRPVLSAPRTASVALEIHVAGQGPLTIETLGDGDVLGWSWLVPPVPLALRCARRGAGAGARLRRRLPARQDARRTTTSATSSCKRFCRRARAAARSAPRLQLLDVYEGAPLSDDGAALPQPMLPSRLRVRCSVRRETGDTFTLTLDAPSGGAVASRPGSSTCCTPSASARSPISISGDPAEPGRARPHDPRRGRRHQAHAPRCARGDASACAARSAPPGRWRRRAGQRRACSWPAASAWRRCARPSTTSCATASDYGRVVAALRRPHARTICSTAASWSAGEARFDLEVQVTVDRARPRLARARRRGHDAASRDAAFDPDAHGGDDLRPGDHDALHRRASCEQRACPPSASTSRWSAT